MLVGADQYCTDYPEYTSLFYNMLVDIYVYSRGCAFMRAPKLNVIQHSSIIDSLIPLRLYQSQYGLVLVCYGFYSAAAYTTTNFQSNSTGHRLLLLQLISARKFNWPYQHKSLARIILLPLQLTKTFIYPSNTSLNTYNNKIHQTLSGR